MKKLKLFFALFAMLALGVGNAWAEEVTFNCADYKGNGTQSSGSSFTMEKSGMLSIGNDKFYGNTSYAHFYANGTITVTPATGVTITKIVLTASASNYNGYQNSGTITASAGTISGDGTTVTWTGSAANAFTLKNNKQIRWTKIAVTYTGTSTPKQKYTLTYQAGSVTGSLEVEEGANLLDALKDITPVACDPTSTEPIGWSESEITTKQANEPTLLTDADVMPSKEHSVYYVFAKKETTGGGAATDITIDLSKKDQITTNTTSSLVFTVGDVTFTNTKVSGSTSANNYCPGTTGKTYTSTRTYNGHQVTIASANTISKIVITAGTNAYATAIQSATWTNATASASNTTVTITPNAGVTSISFKPSATAGMTKVVVTTGGGTTTISDYTTTCTGTEEPVASLTVNPNSLDFGTYKLESSAEKQTQKLTIKGANLTSNIILSVAAPFEIQGGTTTLTPSDGAIDQEITLVYNPTAAGAHNGTLTIASENSEFESKTVSLTGIAKAPCTVNIYVEGEQQNTTQYYQGDVISFPVVTACVGNVHVGWTATENYNDAVAPTDLCTSYTIPTDQTAELNFYAVYGKVDEGGEVVDELNYEFTRSEGTAYIDWSGKTAQSSAVYAGQTGGLHSSIQLRTDNNNSGIITTASGGKVTKVVVEWNTNTPDGRILDIYGKNSAYSAATDLYADETKGTNLGSITKGTSTELVISGDYEYIGLRSASKAMYLTTISITWSSVSYSNFSTTCVAAGVEAPTFSKTAGNFTEAFDLTIECETAGATIYYTTDGTNPTNESYEYTDPVKISKSTVVKAIAIKDAVKSNIASVTYLYINTEATAYTISEAYEVIDSNLGLTNELYVKGKIHQVDNYNSTHKSITYWITDESKQLQVYGGKGLKTTENPEGNFESINDLVVNADVVVCGKLKKFTQSGNTIYEFDVNSYLVSYNPPADVEPKAITIDAEIEGGSISIKGNLTEANPGTTITLYYQADDHYTFTSWSVTDENGNPVEVENNTFTMPETAVTISAVFTENAKYTLTLVAEPIAGGSVKFEGKDGSAIEYYVDETPTIIAEPNGGYLFNSWSVSGTATLQNASKATTTVTEFSSAVTITANFVEVKEITITLHEPGSKTSTVNCYANQQIYLPNATTLAEGKTFVGWTTNSNLTSATKPASAFYEKNILYTVPATATDLYAVYATASGTEYILTNAASITQGEYVLTDKDYKVATGSFQKENEEGGDLVVTEVGATVNDNKITTLPDGAAVCTLAGNNEDGFTILFEEGYLGYMSTNQNRNLAFKNEFSTIKWIAEAHKDKVNGLTLYSPYGGDSKYRISTNGSGNTTIRGYNNGAAYKELYLFKETSSYSNYTTSVTLQLTMAFEKEVYTVRYGETFETPELQTNYIVTGVTYNSSEPTVASVNTNTGEISTGEIGQTTITATYAGTSEYSAASASYILKVVSPNVDIITSAELTATSTQYKEFEHVGTITGTTYIGKTAKNGENIQISDDGTRGDGIVSIKSKGYIRSITITFVTSDKQVDIYGSELPYNSSKDLYDNNTRGASLGSLMASGGEYTKTLTIADDINIPHIGIRAKNGAVQIEEIAIEWEMYDLVRAVNKGDYGTICLKNNVVKYDGATFFEVAGKEDNKLVFDEVTELEAGKPYIFLAESDELVAIYGTETATEAGKHNSLQGTFEYITDGEAGAVGNKLEGNYMVVNNIIKKCGARCKLPENRAYFVAAELESLGTAPAQMPGRRRVTMGVTGENEATGVDNITENGVIAPKKLIENGQLIIIRDGVKYNVQGQKL